MKSDTLRIISTIVDKGVTPDADNQETAWRAEKQGMQARGVME